MLWLVLLFTSFSVACKERSSGTPEALCQAARTGDIKRVRSLISTGVDVNARIMSAWTALHEAAVGGHKDVVELLIAKGAEIDARDDWNRTILSFNCYRRSNGV